MTLSSASTLDQVIASYMDNAAYEEQSNVPMCRSFITSCKILMVLLPTQSKQGSRHELTFDLKRVEAELEFARQWLATVGATLLGTGGSAVTYASFENFRG